MLISASNDPRPFYRLRQRFADVLLPKTWAGRVDEWRDESLQITIARTQDLFEGFVRPYYGNSAEARIDVDWETSSDKEAAATDRVKGAKQAAALGEVGGMRLMGPIRGFLRQALSDHKDFMSYGPHLRLNDLKAIKHCLIALPSYGIIAANALEEIAPFCSLRDNHYENRAHSDAVRFEAITAIGKLGKAIIENGDDRYYPYLRSAAKAALCKNETRPEISIHGLETIESLAMASIANKDLLLMDFFQQSKEALQFFVEQDIAKKVQERAQAALMQISRTNSDTLVAVSFPCPVLAIPDLILHAHEI